MTQAGRNSAHLALPEIGEQGQQAIEGTRVMLIGAGGLGCAAASYLAAAGIGRLVVVDHDRVADSNLGRQILYSPADIGEYKVGAMAQALRCQRPDLDIQPVVRRADATWLKNELAPIDLVLDASDNFATRLAVNDACLAVGRPWVMGAAIRFEGQLGVFRADCSEAPCYRCAYGDAPDILEDCAGAGVFGPLVGVIGAAMASQSLLIAAGLEASQGLHLLDARTWSWHCLTVRRRPACEACANG